MAQNTLQVLQDPRVIRVLEQLHQKANKQFPKLLWHYLPNLPRLLLGGGIPWDKSQLNFYKDKYIAIEPDQGCLLYLLARSINAKTIVEYGSSFGISAIYLATAVRDNGGGLVIGTEMVPEKVIQARQNIQDAGLETFVEIREGNALDTLKHLNLTVDMVLIDGWVHLALDVLKLIDPFIRTGGIVLADNVGTFKDDLQTYVDFLQNPMNGYCSSTLNLKGGTELSIKVR